MDAEASSSGSYADLAWLGVFWKSLVNPGCTKMNEEKVQKGVGSSESSTDPAGETADGTLC